MSQPYKHTAAYAQHQRFHAHDRGLDDHQRGHVRRLHKLKPECILFSPTPPKRRLMSRPHRSTPRAFDSQQRGAWYREQLVVAAA
jgi:hypothetical protein